MGKLKSGVPASQEGLIFIRKGSRLICAQSGIHMLKKLWIGFKSIGPTFATVLFVSFFTMAKYLRYFSQAGDGASYVGMIASVRQNFRYDPYLFSSIITMNQQAWIGPKAWCSQGFDFTVPPNASVLQWHAYLLTFPLGVLSRISHIPPAMVASFAEAFAVGLTLFLIWRLVATKHGNRLLASALLIVLVTSPILNLGSAGQLQPERLFILPACLILVQIDNFIRTGVISRALVISSYIGGALISERCAFTLGWMTLIYFFISNPRYFLRPHRNLFLVLGLLCGVWWFFWTRNLQSSFYYQQIDFQSLVRGLKFSLTDDLSSTTKMFVVLLPLIFASLRMWRALFIAFISVVPNLVISVGGAEKSAYVTHYHSVYLALFAASSLVGSIALAREGLNNAWFQWRHGQLTALVIIVALLGINLNLTFKSSAGYSLSHIKKNIKVIESSYGWVGPKNLRTQIENKNLWIHYVDDIPLGKTISAPEWILPSLVNAGHQKISYYPLGVASADIIFAEYDHATSQITLLPWLLSQSDAKKIGGCIATTIASRGIKRQIPIGFPSPGMLKIYAFPNR